MDRRWERMHKRGKRDMLRMGKDRKGEKRIDIGEFKSGELQKGREGTTGMKRGG